VSSGHTVGIQWAYSILNTSTGQLGNWWLCSEEVLVAVGTVQCSVSAESVQCTVAFIQFTVHHSLALPLNPPSTTALCLDRLYGVLSQLSYSGTVPAQVPLFSKPCLVNPTISLPVGKLFSMTAYSCALFYSRGIAEVV
jgi:hypothetical protein